MRWKVAIVASRDNQRHLTVCYRHLESLGLLSQEDDGLHVFCSQGTKVNDDDRIVRHRPRTVQTEREVWTDAIETMSRAYGTTTDLFLFTVPNLVYWAGIKRFCEDSVEPNYISMYLPYTPDPFYMDSSSSNMPCAMADQVGWCENSIVEVSEACTSIVMHRHSARVVATYLQDICNHNTHCWKNAFSMVLSQLIKLKCYCALPSMATRRSLPGERLSLDNPVLRDTVTAKEHNFYLN